MQRISLFLSRCKRRKKWRRRREGWKEEPLRPTSGRSIGRHTREECKTKWLPETDTDDSSFLFFPEKEESSSVTTFDARKRKEDVEEVVSGGRDKNNIQWRNSCLCRGWTHFLLPQCVFLFDPSVTTTLSKYTVLYSILCSILCTVFCQQDKRTWKESIQLQMKNWSNSLRFMVIPFFECLMFPRRRKSLKCSPKKKDDERERKKEREEKGGERSVSFLRKRTRLPLETEVMILIFFVFLIIIHSLENHHLVSMGKEWRAASFSQQGL